MKTDNITTKTKKLIKTIAKILKDVDKKLSSALVPSRPSLIPIPIDNNKKRTKR